ncbi:MAG: sigma-54-dependent Fis family transcriptional regulator [Anaerolineae bacterium]|nr:sigma-54-dependent Fis family transcriptional regulator [Gemmatimonadaceae bacterium]
MELLLEIWREVCRHPALDESLARIAALLSAHLPPGEVLVRRLDPERSLVETVAIANLAGPEHSEPARTECSAGQIHSLLAWCRAGRVRRATLGDRDALLALLASPATEGSIIAGPLSLEDRPLGALLVTAQPGQLDGRHEALIQSLREPVSVALTNDSRLREGARQREVLDADKRWLLLRLDREEIADAVIGADGGLRDVMERVDQIAATDTPVLLYGERGTGREVIARAIHGRSRRATGPVVRVNCAALTPALAEAELFGQERGAQTGGGVARKGWFERADGGTLFLDEASALPEGAQESIVRILTDGSFERIGGSRSVTVDLRIMAATHQDLAELVEQGEFREDLWQRLGVSTIRLPALRERLTDIPALAAHFAWRAGKRLTGMPLSPSLGDIDALVAYPWPGNIPELAAVVERAAILGDGRSLDVAAALGQKSPVRSERGQARRLQTERVVERATQLADSFASAEVLPLDAAMAKHIESALEISHGQIEGSDGAAALLGINPHTLRARMRKLGVEWVRFREEGGAGMKGAS